MTPEHDALRDRFLAAIEHEILNARSRLRNARDEVVSPRAQALVAIADVTVEWLEGERDRIRAGGPFDEDAARRFLGEAK